MLDLDFDDLPDVSLSDAVAESVAIKSPEEIRNEWLAARRGYFTASCAGQLMGYEDKDELPAGAKTYAKKVAIERMTKFNPHRPNGFKSAAMQWGNDTELQAIEAFTDATGIKLDNFGENQRLWKITDWVSDDELQGNVIAEWVAATPDANTVVVLNSRLSIDEINRLQNQNNCPIECKCPNSETHFDYLQIETQEEFKKVCKDYYWQMHQQMLCMGASHGYFVSYDPDFIDESKQLKILKIDRNEADIAKLVKRLTLAIDYAKSLIK